MATQHIKKGKVPILTFIQRKIRMYHLRQHLTKYIIIIYLSEFAIIYFKPRINKCFINVRKRNIFRVKISSNPLKYSL